MPSRRSLVLAAVGAALLLGGGAWWMGRGRPLPPPPRPGSFEDVDPLAADLIETLLTQTDAAPRDAERRAKLAIAYHANGLPALAEPTYLQALERRDDDARWWYLLALARHERGDYAGSLTAIERAASLAPAETLIARRRGLWLLESDRLADAERELGRALTLAPNDAGALVTLARVQLADGRPEAAAETLGRLAAGPDVAGYVNQLLGQAYHRLGRREEARRRLAAASVEPPAWPDAWAASLDDYRRSLRALMMQADALAAGGHFDDAVARLLELRRHHPRNATVLAKLGECCLDAGRVDEARRYLEDAVDVDDDYTPAHLHLARLERQQGNLHAALTHANRAVRLHPTLGPAHLERANALMSTEPRSWVEIEQTLSNAIRYGSADPDTRLNLALAFLQQERLDEAAATATRVLDGHPYNFRGLMLLTVIQIERGDPDAAEELVRRAATLRPDDPSVAQALTEIARVRRRQPVGRAEPFSSPRRQGTPS